MRTFNMKHKKVFLLDLANNTGKSDLYDLLKRNNFDVEAEFLNASKATKYIKTFPPDYLVINYDALPHFARQTALQVREHPKTSALPIIFLGGNRESLEILNMMEINPIFANRENLVRTINTR